MVTLAALCTAADIDLATSADDELRRIWTKVPEIRAKHAAKPKHSPLPDTATNDWGRQDMRKAFQGLARATPSGAKVMGVDWADGVDTTVYGRVDSKGITYIDAIEQVVWQPMTTAPRDGSVVILRWGDDGETVAWYVADSEFPWGFVDTGSSANEAGYFINHAKDAPEGATHWRPFTRDTSRLLAISRGIGLREVMHGIRATEARQLLAAFFYVAYREEISG
jgi:hypothetical protein